MIELGPFSFKVNCGISHNTITGTEFPGNLQVPVIRGRGVFRPLLGILLSTEFTLRNSKEKWLKIFFSCVEYDWSEGPPKYT